MIIKLCDRIIWIGFIIFALGSCLSISVAQIGIFSSLIAWIVNFKDVTIVEVNAH